MNMNRIVSMVLRRLLGRAMNKGIERAAGGGKAREEMTPEERQQARMARQSAKRARQAARLARRLR